MTKQKAREALHRLTQPVAPSNRAEYLINLITDDRFWDRHSDVITQTIQEELRSMCDALETKDDSHNIIRDQHI